MPIWTKAAGIGGIIFAILTLVITLLKQVIAFIGFITFAVKLLILFAFVALFLGVGLLVFRTWNSKRRVKE